MTDGPSQDPRAGGRPHITWRCPECTGVVVLAGVADELEALLGSVAIRAHVAEHLQWGTPPPTTTAAAFVGGAQDGLVMTVQGCPATLQVAQSPSLPGLLRAMAGEEPAAPLPVATTFTRGGRRDDGTVTYWHPSLVEAARRRLGEQR